MGNAFGPVAAVQVTAAKPSRLAMFVSLILLAFGSLCLALFVIALECQWFVLHGPNATKPIDLKWGVVDSGLGLLCMLIGFVLIPAMPILSTGKCAECGYDLRATPNRCPECGTLSVARRTLK